MTCLHSFIHSVYHTLNTLFKANIIGPNFIIRGFGRLRMIKQAFLQSACHRHLEMTVPDKRTGCEIATGVGN